MKNLILVLSVLLCLVSVAAAQAAERGGINITLSMGKKIFQAKLDDNAAARAFIKLLPVTLDMSELNGNEYYKYLDNSLPVKSSKTSAINAGDIKLYGSDCVVIFYKSFTTSYSYTPLGKIINVNGLEDALKSCGGKVTLSLDKN
ncbi:MAG: hypothetical protein IJ576_08345 [Synergistaceae bacterium]|nr:hypothetical protein [Synergistaceae bacterium]MBR1603093.1 hypothetical protein [Synergistaceae bacterium]